jgi:DAK2 domain fusion protein YloV
LEYLDKDFFLNFFYQGYKEVEKRKEDINKLNVFPVPDGDTGTNMFMTLQSSYEEIQKNNPKSVGEISQCIARGSLMGARGNSGVIMSQIFKGMNIVLKEKEKITPKDFALSFVEGVSKAYKAVIKPVEGTILTVAKSFAKTFYEKIKEGKNLEDAFLDAIIKGRETLKKTPEMLSILKEAQVVDAGGLGFLCFVEGGYKAIKGKEVELEKIELKEPKKFKKLLYPYDVVILLSTNLKEETIIKDFNIDGDSLIVGKEEDFFKIHYHTNNLFDLINYFSKKGTIIKINIENMQYEIDKLSQIKKEVGFVAVSRGKGFEKILKEAGVDYIVEGGQSFNPSTKDILEGIESVNADKIIIFPNNSNVYFSALQTKELTNKKIEVIPTKSIPECITSLTMVDKNKSFDEIVEDLKEYIKNIRVIEVTKSIRDTVFNGTKIKEGDYISIFEEKIVSNKDSPEKSLIEMLKTIEIEDGTLISIYYGEDIDENRAEELKEELQKSFPNCDIEIYYGGQPLYYYIVALE